MGSETAVWIFQATKQRNNKLERLRMAKKGKL